MPSGFPHSLFYTLYLPIVQLQMSFSDAQVQICANLLPYKKTRNKRAYHFLVVTS